MQNQNDIGTDSIASLAAVDVARDLAIIFEPDGYVLDGPKLMGRQVAGNGFLRAAAQAVEPGRLHAYTPQKASAERFEQTLREFGVKAPLGQWIPPRAQARLQQVGTLYMPGPIIGPLAVQRARIDAAAWSICGVTHTICSEKAVQGITEILSAPVMPWDALVCTSKAAVSAVSGMLESEAEYLRWRMGASRFVLPQIPLIPLGVHTADFASNDVTRASARDQLGLASDEIALLFVGRLNLHAKGHPLPMMRAASEAAKRTGRRVRLLLCGWYASEATAKAFRTGAAEFAANVSLLELAGQGEMSQVSQAVVNQAYAASDIFISISDNIQETFGLTPLEAMAAGLPVVVTDWDGYRDTVRHGIDGFRIRTIAPGAPEGRIFAERVHAGVDNYDHYIGRASLAVAGDYQALVESLELLFNDESLRRRMGSAGREHVHSNFDWSVIFKRYQELWGELAAIREKGANKVVGVNTLKALWRWNPFQTFAAFPTEQVSSTTEVRRVENDLDWRSLRRHPMFNFANGSLPDVPLIEAVLQAIPVSGTAQSVADEAKLPLRDVALTLLWLAKIGCVTLKNARVQKQSGEA